MYPKSGRLLVIRFQIVNNKKRKVGFRLYGCTSHCFSSLVLSEVKSILTSGLFKKRIQRNSKFLNKKNRNTAQNSLCLTLKWTRSSLFVNNKSLKYFFYTFEWPCFNRGTK